MPLDGLVCNSSGNAVVSTYFRDDDFDKNHGLNDGF